MSDTHIDDRSDARLREAIERLPDKERAKGISLFEQHKNAQAVYDALDSSVSSSSSENITDTLLRMMRLREKAIEVEQNPTPSFKGALDQYTFAQTLSPNRRVTRWLSSTQTSPTPAVTSTCKVPTPAMSSPTRKASSRATSLKRKATEPASASPSPSKKKKRPSSSYAPPSKYAYLTNHLTDSLAPNLICIFIGVNPGIRTATTGHAYSHPSNLFWKLAYSSGCTPRLCRPEEDQDLPRLYALGHTNIVSRPTKDAGELSKSEMDEGVAILEEKIRKWRPESVAIVGKSIWESVWRVRHKKKCGKDDFRYGWQDDSERMGIVGVEGEEGWPGARVFVTTTTSGLAAGMRPHEKEEVWRGLGEWVKRRRIEKGIPDEGGLKLEVVGDGEGMEAVKEEVEEAMET
ncbi:hypothetical protein HO133_009256 [Letharia lupina]|uniref:Uracil-DNA glycosylase-like domain-containing protein n=1 Tax=Letharia lupina TaxID=560253 RepID=A0A8H6CN00_9LECA|nr:uncharacterized protein HO133_009256 [Letharia lupina]KAF6226390.1 hypothetical protein HO133_009256 [Letharia lupina]